MYGWIGVCFGVYGEFLDRVFIDNSCKFVLVVGLIDV